MTWGQELGLDDSMVLLFKCVSCVCGRVGHSEWSLWETCLQIQVGESQKLIQKHENYYQIHENNKDKGK